MISFEILKRKHDYDWNFVLKFNLTYGCMTSGPLKNERVPHFSVHKIYHQVDRNLNKTYFH